MGKSKQAKEKKFDRNVEISAPILDPEIIRAIHTPPKGQRIDIKHGGFKALLSDLNSQDSTDELAPLDDNHVPSYIGISCAVSGYSNYSPYNKHRPASHELTVTKGSKTRQLNSSSRTTSPLFEHHHEVHHIKIDKNNIHSVDEERKELTEKLTASATERRRSPSPCIPPTEDDRHHGAYVGARYCPLPPPSKLVNKHIPLLGIDDDQDPDEFVEEDTNKVEHKIASLYGEDFVEDWRESMTHKAKNVTSDQEQQQQNQEKSPKDLVTLKPTPHVDRVMEDQKTVEVPTPNIKVLAGVEKQFLNKLLTDENPPMPSPSPEFHHHAPPKPDTTIVTNSSEKFHSSPQPEEQPQRQPEPQQLAPQEYPSPPVSPSPPASPALPDSPAPPSHENDEEDQQQPMSPDSGKSQSFAEEELVINAHSHDNREEHIEYEIRSQSPIDNQSSPVKIRTAGGESGSKLEDPLQPLADQKLVTFSPAPAQVLDQVPEEEEQTSVGDTQLPQVDEEEEEEVAAAATASSDSHDGRYYLGLLEQEKSFILDEVRKAEELLEGENLITENFDEDTIGRIRSAIGKANLLVNKKFNQFKELCEANISNKNSNEQFATLNDDLAGYWDMLSIQVNDIRKSFETIRQEKESTWRGSEETGEERQSHEMKDTTSRQVGAIGDEDGSESVLASSSLKATTNAGGSSKPKLSAQKDQERHERLQEHINQMKQSQAAKVSSENLLDDMNSGFSG